MAPWWRLLRTVDLLCWSVDPISDPEHIRHSLLETVNDSFHPFFVSPAQQALPILMLTIYCSLPSLPLFLATWLYPEFYKMNAFWTPVMWWVPGLVCEEFVTIFFPLYELRKMRKQQASVMKAQSSRAQGIVSKYSMSALEAALENDADSLEEFAVTKDFTGENIVFLRSVRAWKQRWMSIDEDPRTSSYVQYHRDSSIDSCPDLPPTPLVRALYDQAEQIFLKTVSRENADYPINLSDGEYSRLDSIFGQSVSKKSSLTGHHSKLGFDHPEGRQAIGKPKSVTRSSSSVSDASILYGNVAPWELQTTRQKALPSLPRPALERSYSKLADEKNIPLSPIGSVQSYSSTSTLNKPMKHLVDEREPVTSSFNKSIFDEAEASIKAVTLENTWLRFVCSMEAAEPLDCPKKRFYCRVRGLFQRQKSPRLSNTVSLTPRASLKKDDISRPVGKVLKNGETIDTMDNSSKMTTSFQTSAV
jgi:hypothetical protein